MADPELRAGGKVAHLVFQRIIKLPAHTAFWSVTPLRVMMSKEVALSGMLEGHPVIGMVHLDHPCHRLRGEQR